MLAQIKNEDLRIEKINTIKELVKEGSKVYIFGGAQTALHVKEILQENGIECDEKYVVNDQYVNNCKLVPQEKLMSLSAYIEVLSVSDVFIFGIHNYYVIKAMMKEYKEKLPNMFYIQFQEINGDLLDWKYDVVNDNVAAFEETYNMLKDDESKATMVAYLNAAITGELDYLFDDHNFGNQYFNDITKDIEVDTYIDCGTFNGDSIVAFGEVFPFYKKVIAFEPDPDNSKLIYKLIDNKQLKNVEVIEKGVFSETTNLYFSQDTTSSFFSEEGEICVPVMKLDDLDLADNKVSLIKMDIEGSEMAALSGAKGIICKDKPAIAICVYHKTDDLITIPQYIKNMVPEGTYDYYLRHHGDNLTELVLYAIPK